MSSEILLQHTVEGRPLEHERPLTAKLRNKEHHPNHAVSVLQVFRFYCMGLNTCQYHVEAYFKYMILQLYQEHRAIVLLSTVATTVVSFGTSGSACCNNIRGLEA